MKKDTRNYGKTHLRFVAGGPVPLEPDDEDEDEEGGTFKSSAGPHMKSDEGLIRLPNEDTGDDEIFKELRDPAKSSDFRKRKRRAQEI